MNLGYLMNLVSLAHLVYFVHLASHIHLYTKYNKTIIYLRTTPHTLLPAMAYTVQQVAQYKNDPLEFTLWMNDERFLNIANVSCPHCKHPMFLQLNEHFHGDNVALRCENA